jgi:signal transduction histidine kinase
VSHELRNPLASLIGQIDALEKYFENFRVVLLNLKKDSCLAESTKE